MAQRSTRPLTVEKKPSEPPAPSTGRGDRQWLHDLELEDAALAALKERKRKRHNPTPQRTTRPRPERESVAGLKACKARLGRHLEIGPCAYN